MLITERWTQHRSRRNALMALREMQQRRAEAPTPDLDLTHLTKPHEAGPWRGVPTLTEPDRAMPLRS